MPSYNSILKCSPSPFPSAYSPSASPRQSQSQKIHHALPSFTASQTQKHDLEDRLTCLAQRQSKTATIAAKPSDASPTSMPLFTQSKRRGQMSPLAPLDVGQRPSSPLRCRKLSCGLPSSSSPHSPHLHSSSSSSFSSSSQIFERDVQEDISHIPASPAIPSHLMTENHIPPVLGASSVTLTDEKLDPDSIEIITHNSHHTAAPSCYAHTAYDSISPSWHDDSASINPLDNDDSVSLLDNSDVRRLSFVSFADVVNGEHAEMDALSNADSFSGLGFNPSASSVRRTRSSHFSPSSPSSDISPSPKAVSPTRSLHSPGHFSPTCSTLGSFLHGNGGELNVETMSQTLRKTASQDLASFCSHPGCAT